ncbi:hypothetical protein DRN46_00375 [Thermococci archaeon]|nr:MAG: hypothetical protein DRN46_00375 [Thermococci archaeon]RLF96549.1 MAG: hypothetical protein DRN52_02220 [Thermococci archaeon]
MMRVEGLERFVIPLVLLMIASTPPLVSGEVMVCGRGDLEIARRVSELRGIPLIQLEELLTNNSIDVNETVYIIGGPMAIPISVELQLRKMGARVVRLWGPNRFETSEEVLKYFFISEGVREYLKIKPNEVPNRRDIAILLVEDGEMSIERVDEDLETLMWSEIYKAEEEFESANNLFNSVKSSMDDDEFLKTIELLILISKNTLNEAKNTRDPKLGMKKSIESRMVSKEIIWMLKPRYASLGKQVCDHGNNP